MDDKLLQRIRDKEQAYLARMAGKPTEERPTKQWWWETENQEEGD